MHTKRLWFNLTIAIGLMIQVCSGTQARASLAATQYLWPKNELKVCFTQSKAILKDTPTFLKIFSPGDQEKLEELKVEPLPADLKKLVQQSVTDSFSGELTTIQFTGWDECDPKRDFDVAVFYVNDGSSNDEDVRYIAAADLGYLKTNPYFHGATRTSVRINESYIRGYQSENVPDRFYQLIMGAYGRDHALQNHWQNYGKYLLARDVVHEFAHIAGLMHEHQRATSEELERYDVSYQKHIAKDLAKRNKKLNSETGKSYGPFNPYSTMSYLMPILETASEKNRLVCELLKKEKHSPEVEAYLSYLYRGLTGQNAVYTPAKLDKVFCADSSYLAFNPKVLFEKKHLLNEEDQELLRILYGKKSPPPIVNSELRKLTPFIDKQWMPLVNTRW